MNNTDALKQIRLVERAETDLGISGAPLDFDSL